MTEPSQYFKGRTVQEQMNEVIGYVDARAEEVAAAKADDVLEPAEQAKTDAIAAKEAAEDARDATLAALPAIQQDIADLKAEDVSLDGRLDTVELKVRTAEGNIVTIQGQIVALQTADGQNVKINNINQYAVGLTGNQGPIAGNKEWVGGNTFNVGGTFARPTTIKNSAMNATSTEAIGRSWLWIVDQNDQPVWILSFNQEGSRRYVALRSYKSDGTYTQTLIADVTG